MAFNTIFIPCSASDALNFPARFPSAYRLQSVHFQLTLLPLGTSQFGEALALSTVYLIQLLFKYGLFVFSVCCGFLIGAKFNIFVASTTMCIYFNIARRGCQVSNNER